MYILLSSLTALRKSTCILSVIIQAVIPPETTRGTVVCCLFKTRRECWIHLNTGYVGAKIEHCSKTEDFFLHLVAFEWKKVWRKFYNFFWSRGARWTLFTLKYRNKMSTGVVSLIQHIKREREKGGGALNKTSVRSFERPKWFLTSSPSSPASDPPGFPYTTTKSLVRFCVCVDKHASCAGQFFLLQYVLPNIVRQVTHW